MPMKRALVIFLLCLSAMILMSARGMALSKDCFSVASSKWKICENKKQSLTLKLKNACVETMQLQACIEKEDGKWECKWFRDIEKGKEVEFSSCDSTGNYKLNACEDIDDCKPKPEEPKEAVAP